MWSEFADIAEQHHEHNRADRDEHNYPQTEWQRYINCQHFYLRGVCLNCGERVEL